MDRLERPLSPHLQVYRWQITNLLSILHRASGVALSVGALVLVYWLIAIAGGPEGYAAAQWLFGATWFKLPLLGWMLCFFFHFANGIRHLVWDLGFGFEPSQIRTGGWIVVTATLALTLGFAAVLF
jgi:succinate dehydrogenase / fumarate reductase cytochrome b subunit